MIYTLNMGTTLYVVYTSCPFPIRESKNEICTYIFVYAYINVPII